MPQRHAIRKRQTEGRRPIRDVATSGQRNPTRSGRRRRSHHLLAHGFTGRFGALVRIEAKLLRDGLRGPSTMPVACIVTQVMAWFVVINESGRALHLADDRIKSAVCTQLKIRDRISRQNPVEMFSNMNLKKFRNVNNQFD